MSDEQAETPTAEQQPDAQQAEASPAPNPWESLFKDQKPEQVKAALDQAAEAKGDAEKWRQHLENQKTETQKAEERRAEELAENDRVRHENSKLKAMLTRGVPAEYAHLVIGSTPEEVEEAAKEAAQIAADRAELATLRAAAQQQRPDNSHARAIPGAKPAPVPEVGLEELGFPSSWLVSQDAPKIG